MTVLEAISEAGNLTDYANRKRVLVIRPTSKGTETFRLDLTNDKILSSDGFYLLPNDMVYVEPIKECKISSQFIHHFKYNSSGNYLLDDG